VATPIISYNAIAVIEKKQHPRVPVIGAQRPTVTEYDGLTFAPVLVENLDAVFGCNSAHNVHSLAVVDTPAAVRIGVPHFAAVIDRPPMPANASTSLGE
jgi:hypothetical protein